MNKTLGFRPLLGAAVLIGAATGCLIGDVEGIPCTVDDECPTDAFCDLGAGRCLPGDPLTAPPNLQILKVQGPGEEPGRFSTVPVGEKARVLLHTKNIGAYPAEQIDLELSRLSCAPTLVETSTIPASVDAGETVKIVIDVDVEPDCANPVPYDWFLSFSGRERRGVFELFHD